MKKQILVGVAFCSLCLNVYAFNPAAEKAQDAQPVSCNIPAMLNDAKNAQWFRPQCIRILAAREARGNLNQSQKAQLKKVLAPAYQNIIKYYSVRLDGGRAQKEAPHFMELDKTFGLLADSQGTYGLVPGMGVYRLQNGKGVLAGSKNTEIVGSKADVKRGTEGFSDSFVNVESKVSVSLQTQVENAARLRKRKQGELTAGLPKGPNGKSLIPAFDVRHLENVFCFDNDAQLEEKDFVFDINILNDMLKERRDFMPLLNFMAENASFNQKHPNYIPPRFVRLVLAYHAENLAPEESAKLVKYVANPAYSPDFRFLAGTVASAYAYYKGPKAYYKGKFRYSPKEASAIMSVLQLKAKASPRDVRQVELLSLRVRPYVGNEPVLDLKGFEYEWFPAIALPVLFANTAESGAAGVSAASASSALFAGGAILVLGGGAYTISEAFSPLYRKKFHDLLESAVFLELPEKYVSENLKAKAAKYPIVNGNIRIPTMEMSQLAQSGSLGAGELNAPAAGSMNDYQMLSISWDANTHALVGESADVVAASQKEPASCVYVRQKNAEPLTLGKLPKYVVLADTATNERMKFLYDCMVDANYCVSPLPNDVGLSERFEACGNVDILEMVPPTACKDDIDDLRIFWRNAKSFYAPFNAYQKNNQIKNPTKQIKHDKDLFARAVYNVALSGWIPDVEIRIFADGHDLASMIVQNLKDRVFGDNGLPIFSDSPKILSKNFIYRFGKHEKETAYRVVRTSIKGKDNVITNEKLMSKMCKDLAPECIYRHLHFEELKSYTDGNDKKTRPYICNHTIFANEEQFFGPLPAGQ